MSISNYTGNYSIDNTYILSTSDPMFNGYFHQYVQAYDRIIIGGTKENTFAYAIIDTV